MYLYEYKDDDENISYHIDKGKLQKRPFKDILSHANLTLKDDSTLTMSCEEHSAIEKVVCTLTKKNKRL